MPKLPVLTALVLVASLSAGVAQAKRSGPAPVAPVEAGDVRLVVNHFANACGQTGGCVEVRDRRSGALKRAVRVYTVTYDAGMETDVQDVFITAITVVGSQVRVTDERARTFTFAL